MTSAVEVKIPRWYRGGEAWFMAEHHGWVMARKPGSIPFTIYAKDWLRLPTAEDGARCAAEYQAARSTP